jgi:serine-threonine kinase receptor-associated protein
MQHSGAVWGCALDEAGLHAATASADFTAKLWDVNTGKELSSLLHEHVVKTCAFSQGKLLTAGLEKKAFVFDVETSRALACLKHEAAVPKAVWHARSGCIITAGGDGYVRLWDVRSASLVSSQQLRAGGAVVDLDLCGDQFVATVGRQFVVCDAQSLDVLQRVDAKVELNSACLSPNSRLVAAGANDLCCHVFDLQSNAAASAPRVLKGHHGPVFSVRWLGSNERLASGSEDGTIRLWSLVS